MRIAAYQTPLQATGSMEALGLIRAQVEWCESNRVEFLCCPEGVLGGLADYAPADIAVDVGGGQLQALLAPLASDKVATIVGFAEVDRTGRLYNALNLSLYLNPNAKIALDWTHATSKMHIPIEDTPTEPTTNEVQLYAHIGY